jgi:predicted N-acyltransferase
MHAERLDSIHEVAAEQWDALVGPGCPFFEHAFLSSLEDAGCVGPDTGWTPAYRVVRATPTGAPVGAVAAWVKDHSHGEFIFDWAWADAARRAGVRYYPKLLVAAPFSPVGGARFLVHGSEAPEQVRERLLAALRLQVETEALSGLHVNFVTADEERALEQRGLAVRHTVQFQWTNDGYADFEAFLSRFDSKRRNQIRRERRRVREAGVQLRVLEGDALGPEHAPLAWDLYVQTVDKFSWGRRYLNRRFFELLFERFVHRLVLVVATREGQVVGGTVNVRKGDVLYGRYWGGRDDIPDLHFEVCSYAAIEACIERGIRTFEAGAGGGEHKWGRGFLPTIIRSAHTLVHPGLDRAVRAFLEQERAGVDAQVESVEGRVLIR